MKKALLLILLCVAALTVTAGAAFVDMPTDPTQKQAIEHAVTNGLINGVSATEVKPNDPLTRAQMAAILTRCFGVTETADISAFTDCVKGAWYYDSIQKAVAIGALAGDGVGMKPNDNITVEQGFLVLSRVFDLTYTSNTAANGFTDAAKIASWAKDGVNKIIYGGFWKAEGNLNPQSAMTRVQFAMLMDNLVSQYITQPGTYNTLSKGNVVVKAENVVIQNVNTDYDIYIADCVKGTTSILNTTAERVIVRGGTAAVTGTFGWVRAVCNNTKIQLDLEKANLKEKAKDGQRGKFYANPAKENCVIDLGTITLQ